jgi:hypothetical protein
VSKVELSDGRWGEEWGRSQIIRLRESRVFYKSFNTLRCRACIKTLCLGCGFLEDVLNEELLKVLIGVVDAELFETVRLEVFESENVQHSYCTFITAPENRE